MYQDYETSFYSQNEVKKSVLNSYLWMAIGLMVTGAVSFGLYRSGAFVALIYKMPLLAFALLIAQVVLVIVFSSQLARNTSAMTMKVLFLLYSLTLGFSMTSIFLSYSEGVIFVAFMVAALYFLCLVFIGVTTKKDMSRIGSICFTGLLAKENVVGTLAVLLGVGADVAEDDATLGAALHGEFSTSAAALSFLAFNLFSTPCIAALGAMKRQLASSKMFSFAIVYLTVWAYVYAFIIYHLGGLIVGQVAFGAGTVVALVLLAAILYLLFRPEKEKPMMGIKVKAV